VLFLQIQLMFMRFIGKLYILPITFLINLSELCIILLKIIWIILKLD